MDAVDGCDEPRVVADGSEPGVVEALANEETPAAEERVSESLRPNYVGFEHLQPIR